MKIFDRIFNKNKRNTKLGILISGMNEDTIYKAYISGNDYFNDLSTGYSSLVLFASDLYYSKMKELLGPIDKNFLILINKSYDVIIFETAAYFHFHFMRELIQKEKDLEEENDSDDTDEDEENDPKINNVQVKNPYYEALTQSVFKTSRTIAKNTTFDLNKNWFWNRCNSYSMIPFRRKNSSWGGEKTTVEEEGYLFQNILLRSLVKESPAKAEKEDFVFRDLSDPEVQKETSVNRLAFNLPFLYFQNFVFQNMDNNLKKFYENFLISSEQAISKLDLIIESNKFSKEKNSILLNITTLQKKGDTLKNLGRLEESLEIYNEIINKFGNPEINEILGMVGIALTFKADVLEDLNHYPEAKTVYREIIRRYGELKDERVLFFVNLAKDKLATYGPSKTASEKG